MDYRYLSAFLAVGKNLNFTLAAKELFITQAAVSRQIRLLEDSLAIQLVIRSPQRVFLTPKGEKLYQQCRHLDQWINCYTQGTVEQELRIGSFQGFLENCLPSIIGKHYKKKSNNIALTQLNPGQGEEQLLRNEIDVAITGANIQNENLTSMRLYREEIVLASKRPVEFKDVRKHTWIICTQNDYIMNFCKKSSERRILAKSVTAQVNLVASGIGITMLPAHLIPPNLKLYTKPIKKFSQEYMYLTTFNYKIIPAHIKEFIDIIRSEVIC